jgi:hypothetical protein
VGWLILPGKLAAFAILAVFLLIPTVASETATLSVSVSADKPQYSPGQRVIISGKVLDNQGSTISGAQVSTQVNDPQSNIVEAQLILTDTTGAYSDLFTLRADAPPGQYAVYVSASKSGYSTAQAHTQFSVVAQTATTSSSSTQSTFTSPSTTTGSTINTPKCFIATATYGSDVSPEVSLLRNFRDQDILRTKAGISFMLAFNAFYYSFSPNVASAIAVDSGVRDLMKVILYPLIGILYVTKIIFESFSFDPEFAVTLSGIAAAFGIGAIYGGPIIVLFSRATRVRTRSRSYSRRVLFVNVLCVCALVVAEFSHLNALLMVSSVAVVLSFLVLGAYTVGNLANRTRKIDH